MSIKIYKDASANAIFIEDANGVQFLNSLQANVDNGVCYIKDLAKDIEIVSNSEFDDFVDENNNTYGNNVTEVCNALNAIFQTSGTPSDLVPVITSSLSISLVQGETINYELTADYAVGYEWDFSNVSGVTTVEGNMRKIVGGSSISTGTYNIPVKAINYNGEDSETIVLTVSEPPFANTKSVNFNNGDFLESDSPSSLDGIIGRSGNGSGSSDAWTTSFFFKPGTASNASQTIIYFGAQDVANNGQWQIKYNGSLKRVELRYGSNNNRLNLVTDSDSLTASQWHHIMVTYDGGTTGASSGDLSDYYSRFKVFIDGSEETTTNSHQNFGYTGSILGSSNGNFRVGRWNSGQNLRNNTRVDEIALWDSDQSANISDIYNSGTPHDLSELSTPPTNWWRMGDGDTYPTLQDKEDVADFTMTNMTSGDIVSDVPS